MSKTINKFKLFFITDYEKEERYLSEMSKKGYRLKRITFPGIYTFEIVEPEDFAYRLSYKSSTESDFDNYVALLDDNGWEYIFEFVGWSYFRKSGNENNIEIFSDNESRYEEANKVFKSRFLPLLIIFTAIVFPNAMHAFDGVPTVMSIVFLFIYILYLALIAYCGYGLYRLRKKYSTK